MSRGLEFAHPATRRWFDTSFEAPTDAQRKGWPKIASSQSTLLLAPTGSGKTLSAFLVALDRLMFGPAPEARGVRVLYVSPLKALGVDVERNLRAPLNGIRLAAEAMGASFRVPEVGVRSGDTPQREREQMRRAPPEILITTPESLYLILTSRAKEILRTVETVIVDEIHSLVEGKRGAHLFLSLERLQAIATKPIQRIGLSATQRPLDEVGRLLGGFDSSVDPPKPRPVEIVDASHKKTFEVTVEVPVEDMAKLAVSADAAGPEPRGPRAPSAGAQSIWPSIHPRLLELIRAHRSTMIFVNSRRLAERLCAALNELAGQEMVRAHHGSVAKDVRAEIEDRLKQGDLPAIVATSSLELGIDMGAVDLVVQIEAPPSVASGVQRIGRAGHHVGAISKGVIVPKFRGDLVACAAVTEELHAAHVEATYYPRNPLDVLAQQLVAIVSEGPIEIDKLYSLVRGAAPFAELPRRSFEGVLDMLSGRYPSSELGDLRPRLTWDRVANVVRARKGASMLAIANAGTIPDRGLFGVFLAGSDPPVRVGELDEEMVFESREGDVFVLGASSWRIEEITHDRVIVSPAPGEPGKMPFWHGDRPGRPLELGRAIGRLVRTLASQPREQAISRLQGKNGLDPRAAENLLRYLEDQLAAGSRLPTDRTLVIERFLDEMGDWCVTLLSPFGARVHSPWCSAVQRRLQDELGLEVDVLWSDDGIVFRLPDADEPPDDTWFFPDPDEVEAIVTERLASTSLFAARFRENAGRALLLPKRKPGKRTPLWAQRRKSATLLAVASRYADFPIVLETYRECLRDVFDLPGLVEVLREVRDRKIAVASVKTGKPSPFAASLLFNYVAAFLYEGDAPLAERRSRMLALDQAQLRELLGEPELRELLDLDAILETQDRLQWLDRRRITELDHVHDALLALGDLSRDELRARAQIDGQIDGQIEAPVDEWVGGLILERRIVEVTIGGERRCAAVEDVAKLRDALGIVPPAGMPKSLLGPADDPLTDLVGRYARTHGPFTLDALCKRFGLAPAVARAVCDALIAQDRLLEGEMIPGAHGRELCDPQVLRQIKQRSLAKLRQEIEPVEPEALARFALSWAGIGDRRRGMDALVSAIEQLQGAPLAASSLEQYILPARVMAFDPRDLDELCASGELMWRGLGALGPKDGRVGLYLVDHYPLLAPEATPVEGELAAKIRARLAERGGVFFRELVESTGAFAPDVLDTLWQMVWAGEVTNDTLLPLRTLRTGEERAHPRRRLGRRPSLPGSEGRWSLLPAIGISPAYTPTRRAEALVTQLLERHGVLTREAVHSEGIEGGFAAVYPVLKAMEEAGRVRRGYFVAGLGATQFCLPGAEDRLRRYREPDRSEGESSFSGRSGARPPTRSAGGARKRREPDERADDVILIAADDPANPYGAALAWPERPEGAKPSRGAGGRVVLHEGRLVGYIGKTGRSVITFLPEQREERAVTAAALARGLANAVGEGAGARAVVLEKIDGGDPHTSVIAEALRDAGFSLTSKGFHRRRDGEPRPSGSA